MFLVLVYTLPVVWRLGKDLVVWTYVLGILPAMSGTFTSYTRFAAVAFPLFVAVAGLFLGRGGGGGVGVAPPHERPHPGASAPEALARRGGQCDCGDDRAGGTSHSSADKGQRDLVGSSTQRMGGWIEHFLIGTVIWGTAFAFVEPCFCPDHAR